MKGKEDFVDRMVRHGIAAKALVSTPEKWVVMVRKSLMRDYAKSRVVPNVEDAWSWSMWRGYLGNGDACWIPSSSSTASRSPRASATAN